MTSCDILVLYPGVWRHGCSWNGQGHKGSNRGQNPGHREAKRQHQQS